MVFSKVLFSSVSDHWRTPNDVLLALDKEFNFDYDPCPIHCKEFNGLQTIWGKSTFVNPPYSNIAKWLEKGYDHWWYNQDQGYTVVFLIPSRTDTKWWHKYVMRAKEIRFIKGRLKFGDAKNSAPFPSAIVVFK